MRFWNKTRWTDDFMDQSGSGAAPDSGKGGGSGKWFGVPWWLWLIVGAVVIVVIGSISGGKKKHSDTTTSAAAAAPAAKPATTPTTTSGGSKSNFPCAPHGVPEICSIAQASFDQPLEADGPVGDKNDPNFYGVDYAFRVDDNQSPQAVAVQAEAQMAQVFQATSRQLGGQVNYATASAYAPGKVPYDDYPLLSTSIGSGEMTQIANGTSPFDVWNRDVVDPLLQPFAGPPGH
jgi:hypothetical protein